MMIRDSPRGLLNYWVPDLLACDEQSRIIPHFPGSVLAVPIVFNKKIEFVFLFHRNHRPGGIYLQLRYYEHQPSDCSFIKRRYFSASHPSTQV
jgi:hypothetical protein